MKQLLILLGLICTLSACGPKMPGPVPTLSPGMTINTLNQQTLAKRANYFSSAILHIPQSAQITIALAALKKLQAQTRREAGNRAFVVHQDQINPQNIVIWEAFQSEDDFQKHLKSPHLHEFLNTKLVNFVQGYSSIRKSATPVFSRGYFSMAVLNLQAGQSFEQAQKALAQLEKQTQQESGNQAFVVLAVQSTEAPSKFVVWEQFKDKAAFDAHLNSHHLKQFLALNLVSFEKGYTLQAI